MNIKTNLPLRIFISVLLITLLQHSANAQSCKLIDAIKSKDKPLIEKLLADPSTDINCADSNNASALMWAIYNFNNADNRIAKLLIKKGADPRQKGIIYIDSLKQSWVGSPLNTAAYAENFEMVTYLIDSCKVDANERGFTEDGKGCSSVFFALAKNNIDIVKYLISQKCDLNLSDTYGYTPLVYACMQGSDEICEMIINAGADVNYTFTFNEDNCSPLMLAAFYKRAVIMYKLLENRADSTLKLKTGQNAFEVAKVPSLNYGFTIYHDCARYNLSELAEIIYKPGDKLNENAVFAGGEKYTPLSLAFYNQSAKYAEWLIQHGADTTGITEAFRKYFPLSGFFKEYEEYLAEVFKTVSLKKTFLDTYANQGKDAIIYRFLNKQRRPEPYIKDLFLAIKKSNFQVDDNNTPLIYSIKNAQDDLFDELIKRNADINYCNDRGESPLVISVIYNNTYAFNKLMWFKNINLNLVNGMNQTALHKAVLSHNQTHVNELIKKGADLNIQDENGNTPLLLALASNQPDIVQLFIKAGADKTLRNKNNETLYSLLNIPENSPDNQILNSLTADLHHNRPVNVSVQVGLQDYNKEIEVSPDGKMFTAIDRDLGLKLFDIESGKEILQMKLEHISSCRFTPNNKYIVIFQGDMRQFVYVYNIDTRTFELEKYLGFYVLLSCPANNETFFVQKDSTVILYSIKDWKPLVTIPGENFTYTGEALYCFNIMDSTLMSYNLVKNNLKFIGKWKVPGKLNYASKLYISPEKAFICNGKQIIRINLKDGKTTVSSQKGKLISGISNPHAYLINSDNIIDLYNDSTIKGGFEHWNANSAEFTPVNKNKLLIIDYNASIYDFDTHNSRVLMERNYNDGVCNYTFSPDGTTCTYATTSGFVKNWSLIKSSFDSKLYGKNLSCKMSCYDRTGKYIVYFGSSWGGSSDTYIYSIQKNSIIDTIHESVTNAGFSIDNTKLFLDSETYSFPDLKLLDKSNKSSGRINRININSNWIAHSSDFGVMKTNDSCKIYDLISHKPVSVFTRKFRYTFSCNFSHDDKHLVCSDGDSIFLYKTATGIQESSFYIPTTIQSVDISLDGKFIAAGGDDNIVYIIDRETGKIRYKLKGHTDRVNTVWFSHDGHYLMSGAQDVTIRLWDWVKGKELATLYALNSNDWAVITPDKLFDASNGAMELINYSIGTDVLQLNQIKERFYEPGLLAKVLGYNEDPIRKVQGTGNIKIFPKVSASIDPKTGKLAIDLTNQGGGIGKLKIFINGKEIADDSRSPGASSTAQKDTVNFNLAGHPYLVPGKNTVEVKALNAEGYLISRGVSMIFNEEEKAQYRPNIYILTCGVSDYSGDQLDLKYASKDAEDMAYSFKIAAEKLFGQENTFVYSLNTSIKNDSVWPNKKNIINTINKISKRIKSTDIFVLYLSGHGINYGGQEGDFYYLTADAYSATDEVLKDNELRKQFTLSSQELTQLLQSIAAHKQVLLIDACASGRLVENLMAKRDISSSSIRALDRMKDRTGVHIITGCAADAVSYEATRYGQGILTYSLLEGIKGAALRENKYVDVVQLFQKAQERVPELAKGIGGIQIPQIISPYGSQSFDIGLLEASDKALIPLAKEKPIIVRSNFQDADQLEDVLQLSEKTDNLMNEISMKGKEAKVLFMDIRDFPESIKLTGLYSQAEGKILLKLKIKSPVEEKLVKLESESVDDLLDQIYKTVSQETK